MSRLLVTGGAGFIGANFVHYWLRHHPDDRVVVLDALTYAGDRANLAQAECNPAFRFEHGDICEWERCAQLLLEERIDCVVHFAAESHVDRSITGPDEFIRTNVLGTHALLRAAQSAWTCAGRPRDDVRFHHVSTDEVYGALDSDSPAFTETTPYAPNSPYSASKAASDHLVRAYHHTYGLPVSTSNCSNNYGPYQFPEKLIPLTLVRALEGVSLPVYGRGQNVRDWLFVEDHCRGIESVLERGRVGATYNLGGCNEWRNIDVVRLLCSMLERRFEGDRELARRFPRCPAAEGRPISALVEFVEDRAGHDWRYAMDTRRAREELGYAPMESFETGLGKTLDWYLGNESWWRRMLRAAHGGGSAQQ